MKLHRNVALAVISALEAIFERGQVAEKIVEQTIANQPKWGKRDRSFFAQSVYEIVRHRRFLSSATGSESAWALLFAHLVDSQIEPPSWDEFLPFDSAQTREKIIWEEAPFAVAKSLPDWLDETGRQELGELRWETEIIALNEAAPVVVRANTLQISRGDLERVLCDANIEFHALESVPDALVLAGRPNLKPFLARGILEVQDAASQLVAPFLAPRGGELIIDTCAGAGGKTLHLAALAPDAKIFALDVSKAKLGELQKRAQRAGAQNIEIRPIEDAILKRLRGRADRVLIDAPCSGLGTLRRQPGLKWRLTPEFLQKTRALQREILEHYSPLLKAGGTLVYATCSILPSENERQVEWFLAQNPNFQLEEMRAISPSETGFDGFFMARLKNP